MEDSALGAMEILHAGPMICMRVVGEVFTSPVWVLWSNSIIPRYGKYSTGLNLKDFILE
jgi:hypothetical protein